MAKKKDNKIIWIAAILVILVAGYFYFSSNNDTSKNAGMLLSVAGYNECIGYKMQGDWDRTCQEAMEDSLMISQITFLKGKICAECKAGTRTECPINMNAPSPEGCRVEGTSCTGGCCPGLTCENSKCVLASQIINIDGMDIDLNLYDCNYDYYAPENVRYIGNIDYLGKIPSKEGDISGMTRQFEFTDFTLS